MTTPRFFRDRPISRAHLRARRMSQARPQPMRNKIITQKLEDGHLLLLPLCPSTNARMRPTIRCGRPLHILTDEARYYINSVAWLLVAWCRRSKHAPITDYTCFDIWFVLPRTNCDAHNYGKVLYDALERGGIVTDDRYILPRIQGVWHGRETFAIIKIPGLKQPKRPPAPRRSAKKRKPTQRGAR